MSEACLGGGAFASLWLIVAVVACAAFEARAQSTGSSAEAERLRGAYPGISLHYPHRAAWAGAEQVYGRPMPVGGRASESASDALSDWLDEHAAVFVGLGDVARFDFEILGEAPLHNGRVVVRFTQRIADPRNPQQHLKVYGVHGRALAREAVGGYMLNYVSCAALDVPSGGLATPTISAEAAKAIAATQSAASKGRAMAWREPELVAMGAGLRAENPREARPAWRVGGADTENWLAMFDVFVDGLTGTILAEWDAGPAGCGLCASEEDPDQPATPGIHHAARRLAHQHRGGGEKDSPTPIVSGTVKGDHLLGLEPYSTSALPCTTPTITSTPQPMPKFLVELLDAPGGNVLASTRTNEDGEYEIYANVQVNQNTRVRFTPEHENFGLFLLIEASYSGTGGPADPYVLYLAWDALHGLEVTIPHNQIIHYTYTNSRGFGALPEYELGDVTAWQNLHGARLWYRDRLHGTGTYAGLDDSDLLVFTNEDSLPGLPGWPRFAAYWPRDIVVFGATIGFPAIMFTDEGLKFGSSGNTVPNYAYSTVLAHEYGHYILDEVFGVSLSGADAFHEGYADIFAILLHDTDVVGFSGMGCDAGAPPEPQHFRNWADITEVWDWDTICDFGLGLQYVRAQHLVLIWRDLLARLREKHEDPGLGLEATSDLFVAWSLLATPDPLSGLCTTGISVDRSARDANLIEVFIADDDNNTLADGTPNDVQICGAFNAYFLPEQLISPDPCAEARSCLADLNADGVVDRLDFVLMDRWFKSADPRADINGDLVIDAFDWLHFLNLAATCQ